jgi:hypothetical protein
MRLRLRTIEVDTSCLITVAKLFARTGSESHS